MRAITYTHPGDPWVLELVDKPVPEPGAGEVRVRVLVSGVNPTDWKSRGGAFGGVLTGATVPNHDGAGVVDAVGAGVSGFGVGDRVWVTLAAMAVRGAARRRSAPSSPPNGSSRSRRARRLSSGASVGIPAVTPKTAVSFAGCVSSRVRPTRRHGGGPTCGGQRW